MNYKENPLLLVIFGITGDLAHRKILPAIYHLLERGELPDKFAIIGVTRQDYSTQKLYIDFSERLGENIDESILARLRSATQIVTTDMSDGASYVDLREKVESASTSLGDNTARLYYLSIPAQAFSDVIGHLGEAGHNERFSNESAPPRLLVEKPFGYDTDSAQALIDAASRYFEESQLYRIDHYLAKETAQNILVFRFNNPLFQSIWNSKHIDRIQVSAYETIGIEGRANFYEQTGALRDIIQSHLLQLLALITMEQPSKLDSASIRRSKQRLLDYVNPICNDDISDCAVRGQYAGYRQEVGNANSMTETFVRLKLTIDNEQWRGTKFEVSAGKALAIKDSRITVHFRSTESIIGENTLTFRLQPHEGISLSLEAKSPGIFNDTETVDMAFDYETSFGRGQAEAYERVIVDAIKGDQSLFLSSEEVITCWKIVQDVMKAWKSSDDGLVIYDQGSSPEDIK